MLLIKATLLAALSATPLVSALRSETGMHPEVYGWCDFTWANAHKVQNVQCGAEDRKCDSHPVYAMVCGYSHLPGSYHQSTDEAC